jgi:hypothetical protein
VVLAWLPHGEVRDVSATPGRGFFAMPSVHPGGDAVVYHGGSSARSRIWRTSLADGEVTPLTPESLVACMPSVSADGARIVFSAYSAVTHPSYPMEEAVRRLPGIGVELGGVPYWMSIHVMNADGTELRRITSGRFSDVRPSFTSDGARILFLRRSGPPWAPRELWQAPADGSGEARVVLPGVEAGRPAGSIDGSRIYFFTRVAGIHRLAVAPSTGARWEPLANDTLGAWSRGPFCDPDGAHLWYHCGVEGGSLCRLPLDGGAPVIMRPPGFEKRSCAHPSVSQGGVIAFDWVEYA